MAWLYCYRHNTGRRNVLSTILGLDNYCQTSAITQPTAFGSFLPLSSLLQVVSSHIFNEMYLCVCVRACACTCARTFLDTYELMFVWMHASMYTGRQACVHVGMYVYVCILYCVCIYVSIYLSMYLHIHKLVQCLFQTSKDNLQFCHKFNPVIVSDFRRSSLMTTINLSVSLPLSPIPSPFCHCTCYSFQFFSFITFPFSFVLCPFYLPNCYWKINLNKSKYVWATFQVLTAVLRRVDW